MLKNKLQLAFVLCLSFSFAYAEEEAQPQKVKSQQQVSSQKEKEGSAWQKILKSLEKKIAEQKKKREEQPLGSTRGVLGVRGAKEEKPISQKHATAKDKLRFKEVKRAPSKKPEVQKETKDLNDETSDLETLLSKIKTADQKTLEAGVAQFEKKYPKSSYLEDLKGLIKAKKDEPSTTEEPPQNPKNP